MTTLISIGFLFIIAIIANFSTVFVLNIAGLPGAQLAGKPGKRSKSRFIFGSILSAGGQSFVYLAYTAFVVNWAMLAVSIQRVSPLIWPIAFLAVMLPLWANLIRARMEDKEYEYANPQVEALHLTVIMALIGFFLFAFVPRIMEIVYGWVPYIANS